MYLPCGIGTGGSIEGDPPGVNLLCIACAVLDNRKPRHRLRGFGRVFTDTLNVACLRGLNPFLPTPRGSPVTIEPHMQNASTFPPASATRPRKVVQFRYARPESGILTTVLFDLPSITPARPLSGAKRYTRTRPPPIGGKTGQAVKSLCTFQGSRPIRWAPSLSRRPAGCRSLTVYTV